MVAKSKVSITARGEADGTHIDLDFGGEHQRSFHLPSTHPLYGDFAAHGFSKKIRDQIGAAGTATDAVAQYDALTKSFNEGKWNAQRNSDSGPTVGILAKALARHFGKTREEAQKFVASMSKKQQADARKSPAIAACIAAMTAETPAKPTGVEGLLSSFGAGEEVSEVAEPSNEE